MKVCSCHREDDGAVVLCRDAVQCLEVAKLGEGTLVIDICSWQKNSHFELVFFGLFSLLRSVYPERQWQAGRAGRPLDMRIASRIVLRQSADRSCK